MSSRLRIHAVSRILDAIEDPDYTFGESSPAVTAALAADGNMVELRDELSFDNGAAGVVSVLAAFGRRTDQYATFTARRLSRIGGPEYPDRAGTVQGLAVIAHNYASTSEHWKRICEQFAATLERKIEAAIGSILTAQANTEPVSSVHLVDSLRGLARDVRIYVTVSSDPSLSLVLRACDALALLLAGEGRTPPRMGGAPFFDMPFDYDSHWNFGTAHGMTGIAHTLIFLSTWLPLRGVTLPAETMASIDAYALWADKVSHWGSAPVYATFDPASTTRGNGHGLGIQLSQSQSRPSWCYGAVGQQLFRLALAIAHDDSSLAVSAREQLIDAYGRSSEYQDLSLCHGSAGLLTALRLAGIAYGDAECLRLADATEATILENFDDEFAFGFTYQPTGLTKPVDVPGLLNGAAGIAAALAVGTLIDVTPECARQLIVRQAPWLSGIPRATAALR